jgi:hypothetical protein
MQAHWLAGKIQGTDSSSNQGSTYEKIDGNFLAKP